MTRRRSASAFGLRLRRGLAAVLLRSDLPELLLGLPRLRPHGEALVLKAPMAGALGPYRRWLWRQRALALLARALLAGSAYVLLVHVLLATMWPSAPSALVWIPGIFFVLGGFWLCVANRPGMLETACWLDRRFDLHEQLGTALEQGRGERALAGVQLVLVPRKPERFEEVAALVPGIIRRTQRPDSGAPPTEGAAPPPSGPRVFLLATMGELRKAYALADVCLVGRSFLGLYGSDMMEPIALGKPTIIGPCYSDFADIMTALEDGGGIIVTDRPAAAAAELLSDPGRAAELAENGRRVILSHQGATARHASLLLQVLGLARGE